MRGDVAGRVAQARKRISLSRLQRRTLWRLMGHLRPYKWRVVAALVTFVTAGAAVLALGQGVRALVDGGAHGGSADRLTAAGLTLVGLVFIYGLSAFGRTYLSGFIGERVVVDLRKLAFDRLLSHGPGYFEVRGSNQLWSQLISDSALLQSMISAVLTAFRNVLILVGGLVAMATTSLLLTTIVLVLAPAIIFTMVHGGRYIHRLSNAAQELSVAADSYGLETIDNIRTVQAFSQESDASAGLAGRLEAAATLADRRNLAQGIMSGAAIWMIFGAAVLLAWIGGTQVLADRQSEGLVSAFFLYAVVVASSGAALSDTWAQLQRGAGSAERIFALLDQPADIRAPAAPRPLPKTIDGEIRFRDVSFRYPTRPTVPVLDRFDWIVPAGAKAAVVGPSGAGKSTLIQLLLRFYDPTDGEVLLDRVDIRQFDPTLLRSHIAIVPQDPVLFAGTLADNIRYARPSASDAEVASAADAANAMEFIERLPEGIRTPVGSRGSQLSGGQRQRVAIARAILRNPAILLLDEPTNALDARSEQLVRQGLDALSANRTTVIIAHKLATVRGADSILVMEHGGIVEQGSHIELMSANGLYAKLIQYQLLGQDRKDREAEPSRSA